MLLCNIQIPQLQRQANHECMLSKEMRGAANGNVFADAY